MKPILTASEARLITENSFTIFHQIKKAADRGENMVKYYRLTSKEERNNVAANLESLGYSVTYLGKIYCDGCYYYEYPVNISW